MMLSVNPQNFRVEYYPLRSSEVVLCFFFFPFRYQYTTPRSHISFLLSSLSLSLSLLLMHADREAHQGGQGTQKVNHFIQLLQGRHPLHYRCDDQFLLFSFAVDAVRRPYANIDPYSVDGLDREAVGHPHARLPEDLRSREASQRCRYFTCCASRTPLLLSLRSLSNLSDIHIHYIVF